MADLKETIISSMANGPAVLADRAIMRRNGRDYRIDRFQTCGITGKIHPRVLRLRVTEIRQENEIAKTFRLVSADGYLPVFEAGQYLNLFTEIDGVRTSRPYSISSSPRQRAYYEITVGRIATGFVSDYFLDGIKVGDELEANGPAGVFHYNPVFHKKRSVFLAGGTGITPFMSMTREILEQGRDREIYFLYGGRNSQISTFHQELTALAARHPNLHYALVLSEPEPGWTGKTGFLTADCIKEFVPDMADCTYYLCGPTVMTDFCIKALAESGISGGQVRREVFGARQDIQNEPGWPAEVAPDTVFQLKVGERTVPALAGESILTALERNGIRVNVCCRSGECSFCRVRLIGGKVFMPRGVLLRLADEKFGYLHSCKAYPISDLEIGL